MGQLINGQWTKSSVITSDKSGAFVRKESHFRHWISNGKFSDLKVIDITYM